MGFFDQPASGGVGNATNQQILDVITQHVAVEALIGNAGRWPANKLAQNLLGGYDTDDLVEGNANEYYTDDRVTQNLTRSLHGGNNIRISHENGITTITDLSSGVVFTPTPANLLSTIDSILKVSGNLTKTVNQSGNSITIGIGAQGAYAAPDLTNFTITGLDANNPPTAGTNIGGERNVNFTITNAGNVDGNLILERRNGTTGNWTQVANDIDPNDANGSVEVDFGNIVAAAGATYQYRLRGTDTNPNGAEAFYSLTLQLDIAAAHETAYWRANNNNSFADFTPAEADGSADVQTSGTVFTAETTVPDTNWFQIIVPEDRELTQIIDVLGHDALANNSFTTVQNARVIGAVTYTGYQFQNSSGLGIDGDFRFVCTTE